MNTSITNIPLQDNSKLINIMVNNFAQVSFAGNTALTPIPAAGTFSKIVVTGAGVNTNVLNFTYAADGKLSYQGANGNFNLSIRVYFKHDGQTGNRELRLTIYKNGTAIDSNYSKIPNDGVGYTNLSFGSVVALNTDDYIEVMVSNGDTTDNVIVNRMSIQAILKQS